MNLSKRCIDVHVRIVVFNDSAKKQQQCKITGKITST